MILIDISNITTPIFFGLSTTFKDDITSKAFQHSVLDKIRVVVKGLKEYQTGGIYLAYDGGNYWREAAFSPYKWKRKNKKKDDGLNWDWYREEMVKLFEVIDQNMPYRPIKVSGCEGDDVIAVVARASTVPTMIVSTDGDYGQLHNSLIKQWNPFKGTPIVVENPKQELIRHIAKGCDGDGIPNIRSEDTCFMTGVRQKPITEVFLTELLTKGVLEVIKEDAMKKAWVRNTKLIDFAHIPAPIKESILAEYNRQRSLPPVPYRATHKWLVDNDMHVLLDFVTDFVIDENPKPQNTFDV